MVLNKYLRVASVLVVAGVFWNFQNLFSLNDTLPVKPKDALATFELDPEFQMELIVHEPLISSPVDMEIDEYGRMLVVEMPGYPLDGSNTGRVRILYDTDKDGKFDKSEIFAKNLAFPNSIMRWKKGYIVTDAPHVLYFEDIDNDGKADKCDTLLTGFSKSNPHVNVNNPIYGLDNWIYLSHFGHIGTRKYADLFGDTGEKIIFPGIQNSPTLAKNASGKSVRFKPDSLLLESTAVKSQFGHTFSPWGQHFLTHNQNHIYHEAIAAPYIARNPNLQIPNAGANVSDHGNETEVYQITTHPDRQIFTPVGMTTSSSGITYYSGGAFPDAFNENTVFVCESVANLVHMDRLEEDGATFKAKRHREGKEFLASKDSWSRPVNLYVGPDGALYVIDYYRRIIEHPEWMSDEAVAAGGLSDGINMGRIYRVTKKGAGKANWVKGVTLGKETTKNLVAQLANKNSWWRTNAQRLLVDKQDVSAGPLLRELLKNSTVAEGRLHALWTLEGLNNLVVNDVLLGLKDSNPNVRMNAIRLAERFLSSDTIFDALIVLKGDSNAKVRYQLLNTLGYSTKALAIKAREEILFRDINDNWVQYAALSATESNNKELLKRAIANFDNSNSAHSELVRRLTASVVTTGEDSFVEELMKSSLHSSKIGKGESMAILGGLEDGFSRKKPSDVKNKHLQDMLATEFFQVESSAARKSILSLLKVLVTKSVPVNEANLKLAATIINDDKVESTKRADVIGFLILGDYASMKPSLERILLTDKNQEVRIASLVALGRIEGVAPVHFMLDNWASLTPELRGYAIDAFLADSKRMELLLDAISKNSIAKTEVTWKRKVTLMTHWDDKIRNRSQQIFTEKPGNEIFKDYQKTLTITGDKSKGKLVFKANCASCHQVRGTDGIAFGPDLGTVHNWEGRDLLANIVEPSLSVAQGFDLWELTMNNEEKIQGMIITETSSTINLRIGPGQEKLINRQDVKSVRALNMSMMPALNDQINVEDMAHLIAYLRDSY